MSWNEIQLKWAAMARRVRSDLPQQDDNTVITPALQPPLQPDLTEMRVSPQLDRTDA
ncbi:MAG: hypothetical protein ACD_54C00377G0002 [uncultured bacterium]|nr:MAG: hypothetical protein ACD_54C00377G0002 [uncultured bacterium]